MKLRLLIAAITALSFWITSEFSRDFVGSVTECKNGHCTVTASSSAFSIVSGLILAIFVFSFPRGNGSPTEASAGILRRFGAFIIDLFLLMTVLTPLVALPALLLEFAHTDSFHWSFQRNHTRVSDWLLGIPTTLLLFGGLLFYFYHFSAKEKSTLGQEIFGYKIVSTGDEMTTGIAAKRTLLSAIGLIIWPISIIHALFNKQVFWWDRKSGSLATIISR